MDLGTGSGPDSRHRTSREEMRIEAQATQVAQGVEISWQDVEEYPKHRPDRPSARKDTELSSQDGLRPRR